MAKTELQIWRDGMGQSEWLLPGDAGTLQTLEHMARIVREDARKADLRRYVERTILQPRGVRGHDKRGAVNAFFDYARREILYREDPLYVERISDLWTTANGLETDAQYKPEGDCGIKTEFFCTCCALYGIPTLFAVQEQTLPVDEFGHVLPFALLDRWEPWEVTPEDKPANYLAPSVRMAYYPIFPEQRRKGFLETLLGL